MNDEVYWGKKYKLVFANKINKFISFIYIKQSGANIPNSFEMSKIFLE